MNRLRGLLIFFFLFGFFNAFSQPGRLLLVGGGAEKEGAASWSTPAYRWAGEGKKVAIVGISTGSLAPYFIQRCGAARAKEFAISTHDSADSQATYDTLISYDVIFFRGGDQYDYYRLYRNTKLQEAVNDVYMRGGTICGTSAGMHILSTVVFTAKNGTAYPYSCIENPNNTSVTLANDFMNFFPGFIFDTHFAERGRFGRLVGFLANYSLNIGQDITGLGMDDMTCMTVDEQGLGTVYGTGCANLYKSGSNYSLNGTKLLADTVQIIQLLHGSTFNFQTGQIVYAGLDRQISTNGLEETGNYTILASGSNPVSDNQAMLNDLVNNTGSPKAEILVLTGDQNLADAYKTKLLELGVEQVNIFIVNLEFGNDANLANQINQATKILFLKNWYIMFSSFMSTPNGKLLQKQIKKDNMITAFVGEDARLAGKTVVDNYLALYASYYAELSFGKGLSLLKHTVLMPDTYLNSDVFENTATAVPYAMARDTLKYGIWLTNHNYMKYTPVEGKATLTGYGSAPVMVLANAGTQAGFSSHTASGSTGMLPRMVAGFEHLNLALIDNTTPYVMGNVNSSGIDAVRNKNPLVISPNPVQDELTIKWNSTGYEWEIIDLHGQILKRGKAWNNPERIDVSIFRPGLYIVIFKNEQKNQLTALKFVKE
ncbi:MAG: T9SS type A sorting domain-containing protein [Bacteroidales bacterium]